MTPDRRNDRDPLGWTSAIALGFFVLALWRLGIPSKYYFDEVHYVPAALKLLDMIPANREHPMFAKELLAAFIAAFGDRSLIWRLPSLLLGTLGLFGFGRCVWHVSHRRWATLAATALLATNFTWFVESRIAMLDMTEAGLTMIGLGAFFSALRSASLARARALLALTGVAMGLALGAKWSCAAVLPVPGLTFLILRVKASGWHIIGRRGAGPIPGVSLIEALFWLGLLPLAVYWATYLPAMFYAARPIDPWGFIEQHKYMLKLQDSVKKPHRYQSVWYQWISNWRPIWFLFEKADGAQRGIIMLGNPFSMLAGLPALVWGIWISWARRRFDVLLFVVLYLLSLGMWIGNGKPVQFYYHYMLPGAFLMAVLAFALDALRKRHDKWRRLGPGGLALGIGMFVLFYPILSGAPLPYAEIYNFWVWLPSWR